MKPKNVLIIKKYRSLLLSLISYILKTETFEVQGGRE